VTGWMAVTSDMDRVGAAVAQALPAPRPAMQKGRQITTLHAATAERPGGLSGTMAFLSAVASGGGGGGGAHGVDVWPQPQHETATSSRKFPEPWSKKHKRVTRASDGGVAHSLSNSFAEPLSQPELVQLSLARGDQALVDEYADHALGYTPNGGSLDLREEIARMYGPSIAAENVLVFSGAQVALQTAAFALAADCHSIVFTPGYQSTVQGPTHAGGQVTEIALTPENGWQIDPALVRAAIRPNTRYMVLNEPYNPAGTLMRPELQQELVGIADNHGIRILSDEVYRLLEHEASDRLPAMADLYTKGISVVTLSKPWGGCGITIGWLAFQDLGIKQALVDAQVIHGTHCSTPRKME
jgi:DNA-binding transcriptional MocR family regulator